MGIGLTIGMPHLSRELSTGLYVGMGWVAMLALPGPALALLALGGTLHTAGALVYARRWPDPIPHIFGFHEVFHALVIGGSAAIAVMLLWVIPVA